MTQKPTRDVTNSFPRMQRRYLITVCTVFLLGALQTDGASECSCSCVKNEIPDTKEEQEKLVEQEVEKIKEELYVETTSLSSSVRKKSSADDERPSAKNVGYLGVAMLGLAGGLILAMDANYIISIGHTVYAKLSRGFKSR